MVGTINLVTCVFSGHVELTLSCVLPTSQTRLEEEGVEKDVENKSTATANTSAPKPPGAKGKSTAAAVTSQAQAPVDQVRHIELS